MYDDVTMQSVFGLPPNHSTYTEPWRQTHLEHVLIFYSNTISFLRPVYSIANMGLVQLLSCWAVPACTSLLLASSIYAFLLYLYRLFLHPLASFPGPPLAAMTYWYESYHEFFSPGGQYIFRIRDMHTKYRSPMVRISPDELHVNQISFLPELMPASGHRRDKYPRHIRKFGGAQPTANTINHDSHRERRAAMSKVFSKSPSEDSSQ